MLTVKSDNARSMQYVLYYSIVQRKGNNLLQENSVPTTSQLPF